VRPAQDVHQEGSAGRLSTAPGRSAARLPNSFGIHSGSYDATPSLVDASSIQTVSSRSSRADLPQRALPKSGVTGYPTRQPIKTTSGFRVHLLPNLLTHKQSASEESACLQASRRAGDGTRTRDPLFTRQALYQLSYSGATEVPPSKHCNGALERGVLGGVERLHTQPDPAEQAGGREESPPDLDGFRERSLTRGVNPVLYWTLRAMLVPFFLIYFRMQRIGREHLPRTGPLLLASNHRSFLDPFLIGTLVRRPVYYMAKRELFEKRWMAWVLNGLGAFPVDRGAGDRGAMDTARAILERGDCVVVFPEGTRVRPGPLGEPRRGIGRLALETGAAVAPVAVIGTEDVRKGWRIRPRKVRIRVGRPLRFPTVEQSSPRLASAVTERIWACVRLQWEWLGGAKAPRPEMLEEARARAKSRAA
jgi:1-acyl-sn-glycerol-3-phosphate acyltransferase